MTATGEDIMKEILEAWAKAPKSLIQEGEHIIFGHRLFHALLKSLPNNPCIPQLPGTIMGIPFDVDPTLPLDSWEVRDKDGNRVDISGRMR